MPSSQNHCKTLRCLHVSVSSVPLIFIAPIHHSIVHPYASPSFCYLRFSILQCSRRTPYPNLLHAYPILRYVRAGHFALVSFLGSKIFRRAGCLVHLSKSCSTQMPIQTNRNDFDLFTHIVSIPVNTPYQPTFDVWDQVRSEIPLTIYNTTKLSAVSYTCLIQVHRGISFDLL